MSDISSIDTQNRAGDKMSVNKANDQCQGTRKAAAQAT